MKAGPRCAYCGRELDAHKQHVRYQLPDALFALEATERAAVWRAPAGNADLAAYGDRGFVRVLLPVHLDDGGSVTFGAWLELAHADFGHVLNVWYGDAYRDLEMEGRLANSLPPWGTAVLGLQCRAKVLVESQIPYVVASNDPVIAEILKRDHEADVVRVALPAISRDVV